MKICSICNIKKPLSEFYKDTSKKDGHRYSCKVCEKNRVREWTKKNRQHKLDYNQNYRKENVEEISKLNKEYHKNNIEKLRVYGDNWRKDNPSYNRNWTANNRDKKREINRKSYRVRRERVVKGVIKLSSIKRDALQDENYKCPYCGYTEGQIPHTSDKRTKWEIEHIIPVSRGGHDSLSNIKIVCWPCNRSKGAKTFEEWVGSNPKIMG